MVKISKPKQRTPNFCYNKYMQEPTIFTRIINGEIPAHKIYEDERVIAILDMHPIFMGHTLVIPKTPVDHIWDLDEDTYSYLWVVSKKIAKHIQNELNPVRVGVIVEGFGVPHTHVHLVPINNRNDLQSSAKLEPTNDELYELAQRLRM
jgi:histidine triad (HIT) family protein